MGSRVSHKSLTPFGVEIDVDLSIPLADSDKAELRRLYAVDGLIVVRGQSFTMAQQRDFCSILGPVLDTPYENFYVSNVRDDGLLGTRELLFHNDVPFLPQPWQGISLHAIDVEEGATATRFASGFRTYERLPAPLRARIKGRNALQIRERVWNRRTRLTDLEPTDMCTVHAAVRHQNGTERPFLFVNQSMTGNIIGLSDTESDQLLEELFTHLYDEAYLYTHAWKPGDIVVWDNLAIQHARGDASGARRTLQRVTITNLSYALQYPIDVKIRDELGNETLLSTAPLNAPMI
jgi:taurine dioxygenase